MDDDEYDDYTSSSRNARSVESTCPNCYERNWDKINASYVSQIRCDCGHTYRWRDSWSTPKERASAACWSVVFFLAAACALGAACFIAVDSLRSAWPLYSALALLSLGLFSFSVVQSLKAKSGWKTWKVGLNSDEQEALARKAKWEAEIERKNIEAQREQERRDEVNREDERRRAEDHAWRQWQYEQHRTPPDPDRNKQWPGT